jgi:ABC-type uncharacterized transport system permease subunit
MPQSFNPPPPSGNAAALDAVNVPAILILVMGALGALFGLYGVVAGGGGIPPQMLDDPNIAQFRGAITAAMGASRAINFVGVLLDGLIIFGALQMRQLKNYPLAMASAIVVMLPCTGCCCLLGLPVGIWALVTINKPEIKAAFS